MSKLFARAASAIVAAVVLTSPATAAGLKVKPVDFKPNKGDVVAAEQGEITVLENRKDPKSRHITLRFVRFKATTPHPGAPIIYLAGGPGGSGIGAARGPRFPVFQKLRESADVIAFDQRGTGASNDIKPCPGNPIDASKPLTEAYAAQDYIEGLRHCWDVWKSQGVAIEAYNTLESAADLDELRRDLGVKKLNLWGISYGTHLALTYMKFYPSKVDRVILAGVEALDQTVKLPSHTEPLMQRIAAAVALDPDAQTPDLIGLMRRVHAKLDAGGVVFPLPGGKSFTIDSFPIKAMAGGSIKNPDSVPQMIQLYKAIDAGAYAAVAAPLYVSLAGQFSSYSGMSDAMDLASGISPARLKQVQAEAKTAILGDSLNFPMPQANGAIPGIDLGERFRGPFKSNRPVMVISGELDGRTSLEEQAAGTVGLNNKARIVVQGVGHDIFEAEPRLWPLMQAFMAGEAVEGQVIMRPSPKFSPAKR